MDYQGTVQGGVVVLDAGAALPDGTRVRVTAHVEADHPAAADAPRPRDPAWPARLERMLADARRFTSALSVGFVADDSRDAIYAGRDGE
jgi:hypothetical protein